MREIKFRAWIKSIGEMICPVRVPIDGWKSDSIVYMQYTGLKDKNGKEIYEGDILAYGGDNHNGVVIWSDDYGVPGFHTEEGARLRGTDKVKRIHGLPPTTDPLDVIGNIYENPRLARMWGRSFPK